MIVIAAGPQWCDAAGYVPRIVSERTITFDQPCDVRWVDDNHVLVADHYRGVARVTLSPGGDVSWDEEWPAPKGIGTNYVYLALSDDAILLSDFAFSFQWRERGKSKLHREIQEYIADVDLDGDRLLLTGLRRDAEGKLGADGGVAWLGSLSGGERSLHPVLPFRNRKSIEDCAGFGLGVVRFLGNGSFIVVPGAEPGIYLFTKDGKVQRVWATDALGLDVPCDFSREQKMLYGPSVTTRQQWVNRYRVVDDIIDTPTGPGVIARSVTSNGSHWDLLLLDASGSVSEQPLPISSPSPWAHIAAATRGDRVVLLIGDRVGGRADGATPRLIIFRWEKR